MKEFTICYTFDDCFITEKMIKTLDVKKEEVEKEIFENMDRNQYFIVKNDQGIFTINSSLVRYVRILNERILVS